jgi:hypothetical protein
VIGARNVNVAECDACNRSEYSDEHDLVGTGFVMTVVDCSGGTRHEAYACKETHIGPAARNVLRRWREGN